MAVRRPPTRKAEGRAVAGGVPDVQQAGGEGLQGLVMPVGHKAIHCSAYLHALQVWLAPVLWQQAQVVIVHVLQAGTPCQQDLACLSRL